MEKICCKEKLNRFSKYKFVEDYFLKKTPTTFYKDGRIQCGGNRQRTFSDLYSLTSYYFKTITKPELASILRKLCIKYTGKDDENQIGCQYCSDIKDDVFYNNVDRWWYMEFSNKGGGTSIESYKHKNKNGASIFEIIKLADKYDKK